jgi:hypothetical protein
MGNQVISEVEATGLKKNTFVLAAGTKIATQVQSIYNGTTYQDVYFENWDPSGTSYRTTNTTGTADYSEGTERSPAETDPMGGNMGLSTPYIAIPDPPPPDTENPTYFPLQGDAPLRVNGQTVKCFVNGMEWLGGCVDALSQLGFSLDLANTVENRQIIGQLGIGGQWVDKDGPSGTRPDGTVYVTTITSFEPYINPFSAGLNQTSQQFTTEDYEISESVTFVRKILNTDNPCSRFFGKGALEVFNEYASILRAGNVAGGSPGLGIQTTRQTTTSKSQFYGRSYLKPISGTVHSSGMFFNNSYSVGPFDSSTKEGRAIQLLHELAHLLRRESDPNTPILPWDNDYALPGTPNIKSPLNTTLIVTACANAIRDLMAKETLQYLGIPVP